MKFFKYTLLFFLTLALLALLLVAALYHGSTDAQPAIERFEKASLEDIKRIKGLLLAANTPPIAGTHSTITLSERDINLGIGYLGPATLPVPKNSYARIALLKDSGLVSVSLPVSALATQAYNYLDPKWHDALQWLAERTTDDWLNINWHLQEQADTLVSGAIQIGAFTLNEEISASVVSHALTQLQNSQAGKELTTAWNNIKTVDIEERSLSAVYTLPKSNQSPLGSYQSLVLSQRETRLIENYTNELATLPRSGSLLKALQGLMQVAQENSALGADPIAENRALILALAKAYGGDQLLGMLDTNQRRVTGTLKTPYTIYGRRDLAQHMVLSAGLSLIADEQFAELLGADKELADLQGGKTISAWDLLADRAGIRLARAATASKQSARHVQQQIVAIERDSQLLPDLGADFSSELDRFSPADLNDLKLLADLSLDELPLYKN